MTMFGDDGGNEAFRPQDLVQPAAEVPVGAAAQFLELTEAVKHIHTTLVYLLSRKQRLIPVRTIEEISTGIEQLRIAPVQEYPNTGIWKRSWTSYIPSPRCTWNRMRLYALGLQIKREAGRARGMEIDDRRKFERTLLKTFTKVSFDCYGPRSLWTSDRIISSLIRRVFDFVPGLNQYDARFVGRELHEPLRRARRIMELVDEIVNNEKARDRLDP